MKLKKPKMVLKQKKILNSLPTKSAASYKYQYCDCKK